MQLLGVLAQPGPPLPCHERFEVPSHHGWEEKQTKPARDEVYQPFFGMTLVTCENGDMRQSSDGIYIYGEQEKREIPVAKGIRGRQAEVKELYDAVFNNRPLFHDGRWGEATLEVCLGILKSAQEKKEISMFHQVPARDTAIMPV